MNRSDLITTLSTRFPALTAKDAEVSVKELLDCIAHSLARGDRIEIRGFGSFSSIDRPARTSRNPKTGETVFVAPKRVPYFKAGKEMRERIEQSVRSEQVKLAA